ncbi:tRNA guanosine(34) transglycosylase Tgt [Marinithermus hydrothermalis]|uniref:Queuine tRNA-ribosyltransferase n=1 Tax=Marinithermus hydrothermalis (strain DSM 14884 / JCM 11576 / T1) TaxID=869210 RepID=F2NPL1_MARHT|nr:tRNA guanosine(34) transglycosylase Tgt [Marinithermus hydrothermalis]AEB12512.1 Queuine tRNA-ribosyltransferase [Marinithermus hydrothermalis DSM 14884]
MFAFRVTATDGKARTGTLHTPHGPVQTPLFMPVGTQATVKGLTPAELHQVGSQIVLANTYHLLLRPGPELVARLGGLHHFAGYQGPWLTDSGGYQVMSLGHMRTITEEGVTFRSHLNGDLITLTPETSIQVQEHLGADIIMAFDECPPYPSERRYLEASLERTLRWLERSVRAQTRKDQALFGITQGGTDLELRRRSTRETVRFDLPGYAIGGLAVGEPKEKMFPTVALSTDLLPEDRPRYLMGVGHPEDLVAAVGLGVDLFDCVYPTRTGRFGYALVPEGRLNLNSARYKEDPRPLMEDCDCYACRTFSRAYLTHLVRAGEMLGLRMLSLHNVRYLHRLMEAARAAIREGRYAAFAWAFAERRFAGHPPAWFLEALRAGGHEPPGD